MAEKDIYDLAVIGGGIVGAASAYKLQLAFPGKRIVLFEKEDQLSAHQTGHNSGVIHSGLYYKPGSYKARNCVEGRKELVKFCETHNVAYDVCGKIVVATSEEELPYLEEIFNKGLKNEVEGIRRINADGIREIEPFCAGIAGIHVPCTGIVDFPGVTRKLAELIPGINEQSQILHGHEVRKIERGEAFSSIYTNKGAYRARNLVFCAGLQADRMAKRDRVGDIGMRVVPFRGDYYELTESAEHKVNHLIYPVPNPKFPFLGVHFTRMIHGGVECGPNAVFAFKREGYSKLAFSLPDTANALSYSGTWKLLMGNIKFGIDEYRRAFSKRLFLKNLQRLIPSLQMDEIKPGRAGVRAQALAPDGNMIDDFKIEYNANSIHVLNAPSPAATSALAIGSAVRDMAVKHFNLS